MALTPYAQGLYDRSHSEAERAWILWAGDTDTWAPPAGTPLLDIDPQTQQIRYGKGGSLAYILAVAEEEDDE